MGECFKLFLGQIQSNVSSTEETPELVCWQGAFAIRVLGPKIRQYSGLQNLRGRSSGCLLPGLAQASQRRVPWLHTWSEESRGRSTGISSSSLMATVAFARSAAQMKRISPSNQRSAKQRPVRRFPRRLWRSGKGYITIGRSFAVGQKIAAAFAPFYKAGISWAT